MTFKSRTLIAGAAIAVLSLSTSAVWAQSTAPALPATAPSADKPVGAMSADKPMSAKDISEAFTKADTNKDGRLDKIEAEGVSGLAVKFEQADTDGNKMISKAEFEKAMKQ
jgi:EF hand